VLPLNSTGVAGCLSIAQGWLSLASSGIDWCCLSIAQGWLSLDIYFSNKSRVAFDDTQVQLDIKSAFTQVKVAKGQILLLVFPNHSTDD
jgi:hypothetical protein